jgi:hypothetical protein
MPSGRKGTSKYNLFILSLLQAFSNPFQPLPTPSNFTQIPLPLTSIVTVHNL